MRPNHEGLTLRYDTEDTLAPEGARGISAKPYFVQKA